MDAPTKFKVFLTKQKIQKNKRWNDGFLVEGSHGAIKLYDEDMKLLDSDFRRGSKLQVGDEVDFPSYLVTVEERCNEGSSDQNMDNPTNSHQTWTAIEAGQHGKTKDAGQRGKSNDVSKIEVPRFNAAFKSPFHNGEMNSFDLDEKPTKHPGSDFREVSRAALLRTQIQPARSATDILAMLADGNSCPRPVLGDTLTHCNKTQTTLGSSSHGLLPSSKCATQGKEQIFASLGLADPDPVAKCNEEVIVGERLSSRYQDKAIAEWMDQNSSADWAPVSRRRQLGIKRFPDRDFETKDEPATKVNKSSQSSAQPGRQAMRVTARCDGLIFPTSANCQQSIACRSVLIPVTFKSWLEYSSQFKNAIYEEINLRIREIATSFYQACQSAVGNKGSSAIQCDCHKLANVLTVRKDGPNKGKRFAACAKKSCKFFQWIRTDEGSGSTGENKFCFDHKIIPRTDAIRQHNCNIFEGELLLQREQKFRNDSAGLSSTKKSKLLLKLSPDVKVYGCSREDLWILSDNVWFGDSSSSSILFAKSAWFGPSRDNIIELDHVHGELRANAHVYAMRGPNIASEIDMIDTISAVDSFKLPLLSCILDPGKKDGTQKLLGAKPESERIFKLTCPDELCNQLVSGVSKEFGLNEEQVDVLNKLIFTLRFPDHADAKSIILVHGVFGSGKSTLLVAMIVLLMKIEESEQAQSSSPLRVLVSAQTNVAVDNILQGLLRRGFEDIVRIGCLKRISKSILKYTLRESGSSEEKIDQESARELTDMLKATRDLEEIRCIKAALLECKEGKMKERRAALVDKRVVGVTCASTRQEIMAGQEFPIIILDESSQVIEPVSFLPLARFRCKVLVACGDPKQLPPTLMNPSMAESCSEPQDLSRTLFSRLSFAGLQPILLKRQYRCHPSIGSLASSLFYENQLINGVSADDRSSMIRGFAPIVFFDVSSGTESANECGSFVNNEEARLVKSIVLGTIDAGVEPSQIGVICLYKAQVHSLQEMLASDLGGDTETSAATLKNRSSPLVSTVDAFQGGEKEIIIVSCCRTESLGFISSPNRMNVAITRARRHLILVGNGKTLPKNDCWGQIIQQARLLEGGYFDSRAFMMSGFRFDIEQVALSQTSSSCDSVDHGAPICQDQFLSPPVSDCEVDRVAFDSHKPMDHHDGSMLAEQGGSLRFNDAIDAGEGGRFEFSSPSVATVKKKLEPSGPSKASPSTPATPSAGASNHRSKIINFDILDDELSE